jgi:hypothetical protein
MKPMNLRKLLLTNNACYKAGRTIGVKGIMVHSTGANNPNLKRYVGPDDGQLGANQYGNHWNTLNPDGRQVCVHGFIGKLADGSIATYQTLPWNHRGWHCGSGGKGSGNDTHISFEICEDGLTDAAYFGAIYKEAAELCAHLCREYSLDPMKDGVLICHSEGCARGIASNHADVMHWFPRHGKNMDTFRTEVKQLLDGGSVSAPTQPAAPTTPRTIKKGDLVKLAADATYYDGKEMPAWVKPQNWYIASIKGDRAVIDKSESGKNAVCSPVNVKYLTVVGAASAPSSSSGFTPYLVKVTADELNIRKGSGTNTAIVGAITDHGTYTIVAEADGTGATKWGKLKSGAGYISLDYCKRV